jgi:hypothetical protein
MVSAGLTEFNGQESRDSCGWCYQQPERREAEVRTRPEHGFEVKTSYFSCSSVPIGLDPS